MFPARQYCLLLVTAAVCASFGSAVTIDLTDQTDVLMFPQNMPKKPTKPRPPTNPLPPQPPTPPKATKPTAQPTPAPTRNLDLFFADPQKPWNIIQVNQGWQASQASEIKTCPANCSDGCQTGIDATLYVNNTPSALPATTCLCRTHSATKLATDLKQNFAIIPQTPAGQQPARVTPDFKSCLDVPSCAAMVNISRSAKGECACPPGRKFICEGPGGMAGPPMCFCMANADVEDVIFPDKTGEAPDINKLLVPCPECITCWKKTYAIGMRKGLPDMVAFRRSQQVREFACNKTGWNNNSRACGGAASKCREFCLHVRRSDGV